MSSTFQQVLNLLSRGEVRISAHGYDELADDGILVKDVMAVEKSKVRSQKSKVSPLPKEKRIRALID